MNKVEKYKSMCSLGGGKSTKKDKEELLKTMTNDELDELINWVDNIYGKIWIKSFKKKEENMIEVKKENNFNDLNYKKKVPNVEELKEIAVGIKKEEDFELGDLEKELLELYKKRFKGDKEKIKEKDYSYWPATE